MIFVLQGDDGYIYQHFFKKLFSLQTFVLVATFHMSYEHLCLCYNKHSIFYYSPLSHFGRRPPRSLSIFEGARSGTAILNLNCKFSTKNKFQRDFREKDHLRCLICIEEWQKYHKEYFKRFLLSVNCHEGFTIKSISKKKVAKRVVVSAKYCFSQREVTSQNYL